MLEIVADTVGLVGVGLIVLAYFLLQAGRVTSEHVAYPLLNLIGALLILGSLLVHWNTPSVVIEIIWIAISLYGLWRIRRSRRLP